MISDMTYANLQTRYPRGAEFKVPYDGFVGKVIGHYETWEKKFGIVLQMNGNQVVHVYSVKWFEKNAKET